LQTRLGQIDLSEVDFRMAPNKPIKMSIRRKAWQIGTALLLLSALFGAIAEQIGRSRDRGRYPQMGTSHDIGGRSLNLFCSGQGSPTVIFGTFAHQAGYGWASVQPDVAKFTRACWYDRAGYGWSDPGPMYRTAADVVEDLRALLQAAHEQPPYVIVGNGDVTLQTRIFHNRYKDLRGAVFVGGNDLEDRPVLSQEGQPIFQRVFGSTALPAARWTVCKVTPAYARVGLLRLFGGTPRRTNHFDLSVEQQVQHAFLSDNPTAGRYTQTAQCMQEESRTQARLAGNLGNLPLIVLASGPARPDDPDAIHELQVFLPRLAAISSRGQVKVVSGRVRREQIVEAIKQVLADALVEK
jgi:hypothetical protein